MLGALIKRYNAISTEIDRRVNLQQACEGRTNPDLGFFDLEPHEPDELTANADASLDEDAALDP